MKYQMQRHANKITLLLMAISSLLSAGPAFATENKVATATVKPWQTEAQRLKRVADSAWRLERAIRRDGFSSAICALNIWRYNTKDAGTFDQAAYDGFKRRIYQKSIDEVIRWLDVCIAEAWVREANFWLKVYYVRSVVIMRLIRCFMRPPERKFGIAELQHLRNSI